jgi:head-tail adaptor
MRMKVQILAPAAGDDGLRRTEGFAAVGDPIWMDRFDKSATEKWQAGQVAALTTSLFVVRCGLSTADLTPRHRLQCGEAEFEIIGIKAGKGRRRTLELTTIAKVKT